MVRKNSSLIECPARETLSDLLLGRMQSDRLDGVGEHISECGSCQRELEELASETDPFIDTLRERTAADQYRDERPLAMALAGIRAQKTEGLSSLTDQMADQIREYRLVTKLGQGGMGTVHKALHVRLRKFVAIKVLHAADLASDEIVGRFAREMEIVGRLDHPNIVTAHDAGEWQERHFLVMEYVPGLNVHQLVANTGPLPVAEACEIIRQAALGLAHAHQNGIVHRDVKPGNLILSHLGQVKLLDLGLAVRRTERLTTEEITMAGQMMGTLDYLAPEQASDSRAVDAQADIYSLGCTLYKLLTGNAPFASDQFNTPASKIAAHQCEIPTSVREIRSEIPEVLSKLLDETLAKKPTDRPQSAEDVAIGLERFCHDADLQGLVTSTGLFDEEQHRRNDADAISQLIADEKSQPNNRNSTEDDLLVAPKPSTNRRRKFALTSLVVSLTMIILVTVGIQLDWLRRPTTADLANGKPDGGNQQSGNATPMAALVDSYGDPLPDGAKMRLGSIRLRHGGRVYSVAFSPDGTSLISGSKDQTVRMWDPATGREKWVRDVFSHAVQVAFSPDGKAIVVALYSGKLRFFSLRGDHLRDIPINKGGVLSVAYSPDGKLVASSGVDGKVSVWKVTNSEQVITFPAHDAATTRVVFSSDGEHLITSGADGRVKLWNWKQKKLIRKFEGHKGQVTCVAYSRDGKQIAAGGIDRQVIVWQTETGNRINAWTAHDDAVRGLAFSSQDETLITVGDDGQIFGWQWSKGSQQFAIAAHDGAIRDIALSADGKIFATAGCTRVGKPYKQDEIRDNTIRLWDAQKNKRIVRNREFHRPITGLALTRDGKTLVTATQNRTMVVWDLASGKERYRIKRPENALVRLAISRDDKLLAISGDYRVPVYSLHDGSLVKELRGDGFGRIHALKFLGDEKQLVAGLNITSHRSVLAIWDGTNPKPIVSPKFHGDFIWTIAVSNDQRLIATASWDKTIGVWDASTQKLLFRGEEHQGKVRAVAFSPDGKWLASSSDDRTVCLWNVESGKLAKKLTNDFGIPTIVFAPDSRTLIFGDYGGRIRFWDMLSERIYTELPTRIGSSVTDLVISSDGTTLVSAAADSTATVWNLNHFLKRLPPHPKPKRNGGKSPN